MPGWKLKVEGIDQVVRKLDQLIDEVRTLNRNIIKSQQQQQHNQEEAMATLEELQAEVSENTDVTGSAVSLINGLAQQLRDAIAANDPAALQALADQLDANSNALAAAIGANTQVNPQ